MGKRYIDANKLKTKLMDEYHGMISDESMKIHKIMQMLDNAPTADVEEVEHGKWIYRGHHEMMGHAFECSVCERWMFANSIKNVVGEYPYCHCGAKMESVEGLEEEE